MNPLESLQMVRFIRRLRDEKGATILLIEHQMRVVMGVCEYIHVLDYGGKSRRALQPKCRVTSESSRHTSVGGRPPAMSLLELTGVVSGYGGIVALRGVSFTVEAARSSP